MCSFLETKLLTLLFAQALSDDVVGMIDPLLQLIPADTAIQGHPVPVGLVEMPGPGDLGVTLPELNGQLRVTFEAYAAAVLAQVQQGEHLPHLKHQRGIVEGEALGHPGQGQAVFADVFNVHTAIYSNKRIIPWAGLTPYPPVIGDGWT